MTLAASPGRSFATSDWLAQYAGTWTPDAGRAMEMATAEFGGIVGRQAVTLAFADTYRLMALLFIVALVIVPFCKPAPGAITPRSEH